LCSEIDEWSLRQCRPSSLKASKSKSATIFFSLPPEEQEVTVRRIAEQIAFDAITGPLRPGQPWTNTSAKADRELSVGEYSEDAAKSLGCKATIPENRPQVLL
jgi:hypothetical protein